MDKRINNGGKRKGAGRKLKSKKGKRVTFTTSISPDSKLIIDALRESGESVPDIIDKFLDDTYGDCLTK